METAMQIFFFLMCLWKGNMIQITTGRLIRDQKTVKCCIAGKPVRKCHMPFWNKLLSDTKLKCGSIWLYFFNYFPPAPQFVAAWLTPYLHHHQAVPGIRFADVVNHFFWMVSQFRGWGEGGGKRERRGETRSDLVRLGDVFSGTHRQQDIPSCPLCYMASSCLPCCSAAETSSTFFFPPSLWALLISSNVLPSVKPVSWTLKGQFPFFSPLKADLPVNK